MEIENYSGQPSICTVFAPKRRPMTLSGCPIYICGFYWCSIGSSGNNSSTSRSMQRSNGGLTSPLKRKVPYTNRANPRTCSHLKLSQPKKRDTIQMKRVLQVSIVDRAVALTFLVTESPKKLNPLQEVSKSNWGRGETATAEREKNNLPNTDHNQDTGNSNGPVLSNLPPRFNEIKITILASISSPNSQVHYDHAKNSHREPK
jgi:hypothetical protein